MFTPFKVPRILQSLYSGLEWKQSAVNNQIFLTFDDGPQPEITEFILEELNKYNAKATFFCVGENVERYPEIAKSILNNGHTMANHTYNHLKGWNTSAQEYLSNVKLAAGIIHSNLFRPPYGRISRKQIALIKSAGYRIIMWNLLSCDYLKDLDKEKSLTKLIANTKPGSIIVFHDSLKAMENVKWILPRFLDKMTHQGFNFSPIK